MPIYEYKCRACEHRFEILVLSPALVTPECPSCKGRDLEQLISAFQVNSEATTRASFGKARKQAEKSIREEKIGRLDQWRDHH